MPLPPAVLLDFDGTLVDSKLFNSELRKQIAMQGRSADSMIQSASLSELATTNAYLASENPGASSLISFLKQLKLPVGVCSNNHRPIVETLLKHFGWELPCLASPDDGYPPKPMPDLYLAGLQKLDVEPALRRNAWVIEDSKIGLRAAKATGATPIYVGEENLSEGLKALGAKLAFRNLDLLLRFIQTDKL